MCVSECECVYVCVCECVSVCMCVYVSVSICMCPVCVSRVSTSLCVCPSMCVFPSSYVFGFVMDRPRCVFSASLLSDAVGLCRL